MTKQEISNITFELKAVLGYIKGIQKDIDQGYSVLSSSVAGLQERVESILSAVEPSPAFTAHELSCLAEQGMTLTDEEAHRIAMTRNIDNSGEAPC